MKPLTPSQQARLIFGAVDEACKVWLNGRLLLERPYPYKGNPESWRESFEVDITDAVRHDRPNVLVVRVEDNVGAGGIWKPVWLTINEVTAPDEKNVLADGGFEASLSAWKQDVLGGKFRFAIDRDQKRSGNASALLQCVELPTADVERQIRAKAWARLYQPNISVDAVNTYCFRVWYRTDLDFRGVVRVLVTGTQKQTKEVKGLNTRGLWRELKMEGLKSPSGQVSVYLNVIDAVGTVWFDDAELIAGVFSKPE